MDCAVTFLLLAAFSLNFMSFQFVQSFVYNLTLETSTGTNLNLWGAFEKFEGNRSPWHKIGLLNAGNYSFSIDTNTNVADSTNGNAYWFYLGAYGIGPTPITNIMMIDRIEFIASTDVDGRIFDTSYRWNCTVNHTGCCVVQLRGYQDSPRQDGVYSGTPCDDESSWNFITNREGDANIINDHDGNYNYTISNYTTSSSYDYNYSLQTSQYNISSGKNNTNMTAFPIVTGTDTSRVTTRRSILSTEVESEDSEPIFSLFSTATVIESS